MSLRRAAALSSLLLSAVCASALPLNADAAGSLLYAWTQIVPGGTRYPGMTVGLARAVISGQDQPCPAIVLDSLPGVSMTARKNPYPGSSNYPVTVCEHPLMLENGRPASRAQVADRLLRLPGSTPPRIAVIGDTGCRSSKDQKPCSDEKVWPFERIAKTIAHEQSPTLVVHVGDYRYRKDDEPCDKECSKPKWDNWKSWEKDFFKPADELLQAAPWLMVRGNHESCDKNEHGNGPGWFYLLDPSSALLDTAPLPACHPAGKPKYTAPYAVDVPTAGDSLQRLIVLDSADAPDEDPPAAVVQIYRDFLKTVAELAGTGTGQSWFLTHRPIWGVKKQKCGKPAEVINATLQQASGDRLPGSIALAIAGHTHLFESLTFGPAAGRPPVAIAGMSGVNTKSSPIKDQKQGTFKAQVAGQPATAGFRDDHGFLMMVWDPASKAWQVTLSSPNGGNTRSCRFEAGALDCGFPAVDPCGGS